MPCDFGGKIDFTQFMLREYGLGSDDWLFVGDGANDVPIARVAPVSVGYRPHPRQGEVVTRAIDEFYELLDILETV